jgi:hypothetical protein
MRCLREEDGSKRQTFGTPRHRFGERRYQRRAFGNAAKALRPPVQPVPSAKRLANLHLHPPGCSSLILLPNVGERAPFRVVFAKGSATGTLFGSLPNTRRPRANCQTFGASSQE